MKPSPKPLYLLSLFSSLVFYAPVALYLRTSRGIDINQFFLLQLILQAVIFIGEIPFGLITDKIGYKKSILLSTSLMIVARLLFLSANGLPLFIIEAIIEGIAICFSSGTISALIYEGFNQDKYKRILSVNNNFSALGFIISTALFYLLYGTIKLNGLLILTILTTALACGLAFFIPDVSKHRKTDRPKFNLSVLKSSHFIILSASGSVMSLASILINFFFVEKLTTIHVDVKYIAFIFLAGEVLGLITPRLIDWLDKYDDNRVWKSLFLLAGLGFLGLYVVQSQIVSIALMVVLQLLTFLPSYIFSELQNRSITASGNEQHRAAMLSMYNMSNNIIVLAGLLLFSLIKFSNPLMSFAVVGSLFIIFALANMKRVL